MVLPRLTSRVRIPSPAHKTKKGLHESVRPFLVLRAGSRGAGSEPTRTYVEGGRPTGGGAPPSAEATNQLVPAVRLRARSAREGIRTRGNIESLKNLAKLRLRVRTGVDGVQRRDEQSESCRAAAQLDGVHGGQRFDEPLRVEIAAGDSSSLLPRWVKLRNYDSEMI